MPIQPKCAEARFLIAAALGLALLAPTGSLAEETGVSTDEILINDSLNQGLLLSAIVIALGMMILELKKIQQLLYLQTGTKAGDRRV